MVIWESLSCDFWRTSTSGDFFTAQIPKKRIPPCTPLIPTPTPSNTYTHTHPCLSVLGLQRPSVPARHIHPGCIPFYHSWFSFKAQWNDPWAFHIETWTQNPFWILCCHLTWSHHLVGPHKAHSRYSKIRVPTVLLHHINRKGLEPCLYSRNIRQPQRIAVILSVVLVIVSLWKEKRYFCVFLMYFNYTLSLINFTSDLSSLSEWIPWTLIYCQQQTHAVLVCFFTKFTLN